MSEEAIVESLHSVFSRPMALVRTARLHAALRAANVRRDSWLQVWGKVAAAMGIACTAAASSHAADNARIVRLTPFVPALPVPNPLCSFNRPTCCLQVWLRCCALLRAQCKSDTALGDGRGSPRPCVREATVMMRMQEACVTALLLWASAWSGAAENPKGSAAACSVVAQFLESCFVLAHIPSLLHVSRDHWRAHDGCWDGLCAVWLEQSESSIEWTFVYRQEQEQQQQQQQQQSVSQAIILKSIENAVNDFPQFPALRSLGDAAHAVHYCDMQRVPCVARDMSCDGATVYSNAVACLPC
jgi:hypothetical protein